MRSLIIRTIAYTLILGFSVLVFMYDAKNLNFKENSLTEIFQEIYLLIIVLVGLISLRKATRLKTWGYFLVYFAAISFVREFNNFLSANLFEGAWQTGVLIITLGSAPYFYKNLKNLLQEVKQESASSSFGVFIIGFIILMLFSRLYGKKTNWQYLMQDEYVRVVKDASEEGIELLGYSIIFIACMEFFAKAIKSK